VGRLRLLSRLRRPAFFGLLLVRNVMVKDAARHRSGAGDQPLVCRVGKSAANAKGPPSYMWANLDESEVIPAR